MSIKKSPIKLRGHHLICLNFFTGEGYDLEFIKNLKEILIRAESGEEIVVCEGVDDVCKMCPFLKERRCNYEKYAENEIQKMDTDANALLRIEPGIKVTWFDIQKKIQGIFRKWSAEYCKSCNWRRICEKAAFYQEIHERQ